MTCEEVCIFVRGSLATGLGDGPFGMDVVGIEVLDGEVGSQRHGDGVDLDDVTELFEDDVLGFADDVRPLAGLCPACCLADEIFDTRHATRGPWR